MGSTIGSYGPTVFRRSQRRRRFYGPYPNGLEDLGNAFLPESAGTSRGTTRDEIALLWTALPPEHEVLQDVAIVPIAVGGQDLGPGPAVVLQAPPEPIDRLIAALYAPHFRRLEQELEVIIARSSVHVPAFVDAGSVAQASLEVDPSGVGDPVLLTALEEYVRPAEIADSTS